MAVRGRRATDDGRRAARDEVLVRVGDLAGRPRGTGFVADHQGTVVTSHEAVDGLARIVVRATGDRVCVVTSDAVTPLPALDLALIRTEGLCVDPLPFALRDDVDTGAYVRIAAGGWREARVLGTADVTYTATDGFHLLRGALELAIGTAGSEALRLGGGAAGGPVLDATTGAVVGVLGTALEAQHRATGFAVPLRGWRAERPLAELLARNAATVGAYGADLNLAGVLELTATTVGSDGPEAGAGAVAATGAPAPVERVAVVGEFTAFAEGPSTVLGLVGPPGSGRTTELAALAARRGRGPEPAPTLWLRGADLLSDDASVADAARRALERAGRIVAASSVPAAGAEESGASGSSGSSGSSGAGGSSGCGGAAGSAASGGWAASDFSAAFAASGGWDAAGGADDAAGARAGVGRPWLPGRYEGELGDIRPERLARLAGAAGRPLLLLLDGPEEMPPKLAHRLAEWTAGTAEWLRENGARLVVACRAEYWERAGARFPAELLYGEASGEEGQTLPACVRLGDLTESEARRARLRYGIPEDALAGTDARHPLTLRLLSEVRAALPEPPAGRPGEDGASAGPRDGGGDRGADRGGRPGAGGCGYGRAEASSGVGTPLFGERVDAGGARPSDPAAPSSATGPSSRGSTPPPYGPPASSNPSGRPDRDEVLAAYLDLMCLRVAVRLAVGNGVRGTAVRRLAAQVSGQVHEAARRCLGPGQGELDRAAFEAVFPWGPVSGRRLGGTTGWASAVLTEGLLVPAGDGYRFAHEELADWIQGAHLDLDAALHALVHRGWVAQAETRRGWGTMPSEARVRRQARRATRNLPVPRHRIGPVVHALLLLGRQQGPTELAGRLEELLDALDALLPPGGPAPDDPTWWATRLLGEVLLRVPDATPYTRVLRFLTERIGAWRAQGRGVPGEFGPDFWAALPLPEAERFDLLRRLVVADPPTGEGSRYLDVVSRLLAADPTGVQPLLTRWFPDDTPLVSTPDATVATAAQALLHTRRRCALDDLIEALVDSAHRRGDELLAVLSEEEPSAVCRAVDRWAHDERPARRVAGLAYALRTAPHVRAEADRELLRYAALALLGRPADVTLHSGALALLVRDPRTRSRHLPQALERFAAGDPQLPASALVTALATDPDPVLDAFRARLRTPGPEGSDGEALRTLAEVTTPGLARRVTLLVREIVDLRPEVAGQVAAYVDRRLEHGPGTRAVLFPLVSGLIVDGPVQVRAALAAVFAEPGTQASGPLRRELLDLLMATERDPSVLDALLRAAAARGAEAGAEGAADGSGDIGDTRALVHRVGMLLVRTPEGATRFDWALVDLARHVPGFAGRVAGWLNGTPQEWAAVVGPSTRRMIENLAGVQGVQGVREAPGVRVSA
ncbi:trypsin-like peptidase domain-containing protein [Streptomyces phaeolivaceus]|uniref:Trypsin-like peptidase domain-containing protein n=1 Tax=Streptomyces phaeolivaceus TaxID=2653200 RepID=A0A5P8KCD0_9ACTN|nr:trypsin-like peptidase domain-containing protein [Streptomyces phaeolivaceus]QFR00681.1 trypsin-like peptidase domain-containing protein [Streptomyces phaeolivaceus]